jgi:hypothetical protein
LEHQAPASLRPSEPAGALLMSIKIFAPKLEKCSMNDKWGQKRICQWKLPRTEWAQIVTLSLSGKAGFSSIFSVYGSHDETIKNLWP